MATFLGLVLVLAVVIYFVNRKMMEAPAPLLKATKKVEEAVVKVVDVNKDNKVDLQDVVATTAKVKKVAKKVTGKTRKPRTKKSAE